MDRRVATDERTSRGTIPSDTQDRAFKLLGLLWSGAPADEIEKEKDGAHRIAA